MSAADRSDSFAELAMPLFDQLYNFAHWLTQNREEAEDLVQETYAKALKGFSSFQPGTNFRAWMYRILRNTFLTSRTGLRAAATIPLDADDDGPELAVENATPETILMQRSDTQLVQNAIADLPVHYREILLLCEVEEMSYQEIAETLAIPIGTVMSRLSRARKTLRSIPGVCRFQEGEPWFVSRGRHNSTPTSMASFPRSPCGPSMLMCATVPLVRLTLLPAYR